MDNNSTDNNNNNNTNKTTTTKKNVIEIEKSSQVLFIIDMMTLDKMMSDKMT
jgi:hypothetical protein